MSNAVRPPQQSVIKWPLSTLAPLSRKFGRRRYPLGPNLLRIFGRGVGGEQENPHREIPRKLASGSLTPTGKENVLSALVSLRLGSSSRIEAILLAHSLSRNRFGKSIDEKYCLHTHPLASLFAQVTSAQSLKPSITLTEFGTFEGQPVTLYTLTNKQGMVAKISDYGGIVVSLKVPDREGKLEDVVLGYDNFDAYKTDTGWYGAIAGRNANRIKAGKFSIDGKQYQLATNNGPNNLHGGVKGFNKKLWQATPSVSAGEPKLTLKYKSPDGEEGFPGNLTVTTTYTLTQDNALKIQYHATTDQPTVCNLTHHSYWNIAGPNSDSILDQQLQLFCDAYNPIDETGIPTGETRSVEGTPFDFRQPKAIGRDINTADAQLKLGKGYDHNFVINGEAGTTPPRCKTPRP